ncbi:hypothetical protein H671_3g9009 [Cricetulus griseus]|uniref:Uncharacterized protein n=1 Tax=Cricetulus griseus TaxID=10029 RepID=A0A061IA78_CRIGR|nr:hypothetical protein H671_3g9009 [Cricetulus griseus]
MANYVTSWKLPLPLVLQKPEKFGDDKEVQVTCIDFVTAVSRQNSFKGSSSLSPPLVLPFALEILEAYNLQ